MAKTTMTFLVTAHCIFCENELLRPPIEDSTEWWLEISPSRGIHYRCVDRLTELLDAIRAEHGWYLDGNNNPD